MEKNFIRVRSAKDIIIVVSFIIVGTILITLPDSASVNIFGFFLLFAGMLLGFILKSGYMDEDTGNRYSKKERYFEGRKREEISSAISRQNSRCKLNLDEENKGTTLRLDVYYSKKTGKAYVQVFEYVPYKYEPYSRLYEHELANVYELIEK